MLKISNLSKYLYISSCLLLLVYKLQGNVSRLQNNVFGACIIKKIDSDYHKIKSPKLIDKRTITPHRMIKEAPHIFLGHFQFEGENS